MRLGEIRVEPERGFEFPDRVEGATGLLEPGTEIRVCFRRRFEPDRRGKVRHRRRRSRRAEQHRPEIRVRRENPPRASAAGRSP